MFDTIMFYLMVVAYAVTGIGVIVALGMTIYAMWYDGLTGFGGLVFFVTMFLTWPYIVYETIADEVRWWRAEHIDLRREER